MRQRAQSRLRLQLVAGGSVIVLVIAVIIFVNALQTSSATVTSSNNVFVGPTPPHLVTGAPVDGAQCGPTESQAQHIHQRLEVVINGKVEYAPPYVGFDVPKNCLYWIHMHNDYPGVIHVEAPVQDTFTLGTFFDIWSITPVSGKNQPTISHTLLNYILHHKPDVAVVNGKAWSGDIRNIPLLYHSLITIGYGSHTVKQQPFDFSLVDGTQQMPTP